MLLFSRSVLSDCDPVDCSSPFSSVHGIFQSRILEWVAISFSRGSFQPRVEPRSPALQGRIFTTESPVLVYIYTVHMGFPDSSVGKESVYSAGEPSLIPGLGRSAGEGIGYPFQYSWASLWLSW